MDLLNQIIRQPVDPDYAVVAARGAAPRRRRWPLFVVAVLIGALFAVAALQTTRAAPQAEVERRELISRISAAESYQDEQQGRLAALRRDIARSRGAALGDDSSSRALEARIAMLGSAVGNVAVTGPGLVIVVDDAPGNEPDTRGRVLDYDLQIMVNGLWHSGAEAVAVNGHRLSNLTAIRGAGEAITVDYRSLTRPYVIEALGDPRELQARYVESSGGTWWNELAENRQMRYEMSNVETVTLAADPDITLRFAEAAAR